MTKYRENPTVSHGFPLVAMASSKTFLYSQPVQIIFQSGNIQRTSFTPDIQGEQKSNR